MRILMLIIFLASCGKREISMYHLIHFPWGDSNDKIAIFFNQDDCEKYKILYQSRINFEELRENGQTLILNHGVISLYPQDIYCSY